MDGTTHNANRTVGHQGTCCGISKLSNYSGLLQKLPHNRPRLQAKVVYGQQNNGQQWYEDVATCPLKVGLERFY